MQFWSLEGLTGYEAAREFQQKLVERRAQDEIPDTVLFLEHRPVITRGRGLQFNGQERARHMPLPDPLPEGTEFCESERGGDLTWHGPGQLVIYPICRIERDVGGFVRTLEKAVIEDLGRLGLAGESRENATGVWVGPPSNPKKVASIGIAVRKWVTYHGIAVNCVNDLAPFGCFSPCGFGPEVMGRLVDLIPAERAGHWKQGEWRREMEEGIAGALSRLVGTGGKPVIQRECIQ